MLAAPNSAPTPASRQSWRSVSRRIGSRIGIALAVAAVACGGSGDGGTGPCTGNCGGSPSVASVTLNQNSASLAEGATLTLTATPRDAAGNALSGHAVTWTTADSSVATVSSAGLVSAKGAGSTQITATSDGKSAAATITVTAAAVASISVVPAADTLASFGDTARYTAVLKDAAGNTLTGRTVVWTSSNDTLVTVSTTGLVTAVHNGTVTITASSGGVTGTATVTVPVVGRIVVTPLTSTLHVGANETLTVVLQDATGRQLGNRFVQVINNSPSRITVSGTTITGVTAGTATVTYSSEGASTTATITVVP
jgi:uncharacterized protein YjdB